MHVDILHACVRTSLMFARCRALVDDGTQVASVWTRSAQAVQALLDVSASEWSSLLHYVHTYGDFHFHRVSSPLLSFLFTNLIISFFVV